MYCSNCGKALRDDDNFCSACGKRTERLTEDTPAAGEEIIFNPSFDNEAENKAIEQIADSEVQTQQDAIERNGLPAADEQDALKRNEEFVWNLYEFPSTEPKKTEDIRFHWDLAAGEEQQTAEDTAERTEEVETLVSQEASVPLTEGEPLSELPKEIEQSAGLPSEPPVIAEELLTIPQEPPGRLEQELFAEMERGKEELKRQTERIEKFYTFSQKNEEFQKLLDREYEKIKSGRMQDEDFEEIREETETAGMPESQPELPAAIPEESLKPEEHTADPLPKFDPASHIQEMEKARESFFSELEKAEILDNSSIIKKFDTMELEKAESKANMPEILKVSDEELPQEAPAAELQTLESGRETPPLPADEADEQENAGLQGDEEAEHSLTRTQALDELFSKRFDEYEQTQKQLLEEEQEEKPKKVGTAGKILLTIIIIFLVLELTVLGIKYFIPDSAAAGYINDKLTTFSLWITSINSGDDEPPQNAEEEPEPEPEPQPESLDTAPRSDLDALVKEELTIYADTGKRQNIEAVAADPERLCYNPTATYKNSDIHQSKPIENNLWYEREDGTPVFYDASVVAALIAFDSQWADYVNKKDKSVLSITKEGSNAYKNSAGYKGVGKETKKFTLLEIGEIRQSGAAFYIWVHEKIATTAGGKTISSEKNWIYRLEPVEKQMKIVDYYEFKI